VRTPGRPGGHELGTWRDAGPRRAGTPQLRAAAGALLVVVAIALVALVAHATPGPRLHAGVRTRAASQPIAAEPLAARRAAPRRVEGVLATRAATEAAEQAAAAAVAAEVARRAAELAPKTGVDWDGIAQCETGGNWGMQGSSYSGGLGFANSTWSGFGGREFAPNAGMASREEQIHVAERVYARYGLSGWGCRRHG
jgi:hypothetical protein